MKTRIKIKYMALLVLLVASVVLSACSDYFADPLVDKNTGEDVNLVIADFNFFHTRTTIKLVDEEDGSLIEGNAKVTFSGANASDIVTFSGKKREVYETTVGQLELAIDPNVRISEDSPFELGVTVEVAGYEIYEEGIDWYTEGVKSITLPFYKVREEVTVVLEGNLKIVDGEEVFEFIYTSGDESANVGLTNSPSFRFRAKSSDVLALKTSKSYSSFRANMKIKSELYAKSGSKVGSPSIYENLRIGDNPGQKVSLSARRANVAIDVAIVPPNDNDGNAVPISYKPLQPGQVVMDIFNPVENLSDGSPIFSLGSFKGNEWSSVSSVVIGSKPFSIISHRPQIGNNISCKTAGTITFNASQPGDFLLNATMLNMDDEPIRDITFIGKFGEPMTIEDAPSEDIKLLFKNNNPTLKAIQPVNISNGCSRQAVVSVELKPEYTSYQVVFKALCSENKEVALAPTYNAQFRLKNSQEPWQDLAMVGGVVDFIGKENNEYDVRLLWEGEWQNASFATNFDSNANYTGPTYPDTKISSKLISDGRIQINVETVFKQAICDAIGI